MILWCINRAADVEFALPFPGKAFVGIASILDRPPTRFPDGTRVATPYGAGVVAALRSSPERIDYLVHFVDKKLANGKPVVGYLRPADVKPRTALMFDEAVADATAAREDGNRFFKVTQCAPVSMNVTAAAFTHARLILSHCIALASRARTACQCTRALAMLTCTAVCMRNE